VSLAVVKYENMNPHKPHPSPSQTSNVVIVSSDVDEAIEADADKTDKADKANGANWGQGRQ